MSYEELMWQVLMMLHITDFRYTRGLKVALLFLVRGRFTLGPIWEKFSKDMGCSQLTSIWWLMSQRSHRNLQHFTILGYQASFAAVEPAPTLLQLPLVVVVVSVAMKCVSQWNWSYLKMDSNGFHVMGLVHNSEDHSRG